METTKNMIAGFGGFGGCRMIARPVAFSPTHIPTIVSHWSGNVATLTNVGAGSASLSVANRVTSGAGALVQAVDARQPFIISLANNVKALRFSGSLQRDMSTPDVTALRFTGVRGYWAWHMRVPANVAATRILWAQWADGNTAERMQVTSYGDNINVYVAISAISSAWVAYTIPLATQQAGMFLEVFYDGNEPAATRIRLYVNKIEIAVADVSLTIPATLQAGNGNNLWIASFNGASNKQMDLAHHYILNDHPTEQQRFNIELNEKPLWLPVVNPRVIGGVDVTAIGQWLYLPDDTTGQRSLGLAMWPDKLSGQYAASDTDAYRPLIGIDGAGRRTINSYNGHMLLPLTAGNNDINFWGLGFWVHISNRTFMIYAVSTVSTSPAINQITVNFTASGAVLSVLIYSSTGAYRYKQNGGTSVPQGWQFVTIEYDSTAVGDARLTLSFNGAVWAGSYDVGGTASPAEIPATLRAATGSATLFSNTVTGVNNLLEAVGEDFWIFNSKMAGTPAGQLLTPAARTALMNLHPMTNPSKVIGGIDVTAIGQWFDLNASLLGGRGFSHIIDRMGGCSIYQANDLYRPTIGKSANNLKIAAVSTNMMTTPLNDTNNNITSWGIACWVRIPSAGIHRPFFFVNTTTASVFRIGINLAIGDTIVMVTVSAGGIGRWSQAGGFSQDVWHFLTIEYDGTAIGDARITTTIDNVVIPAGFGGAGTTEMPATLTAATGSALFYSDGVGPGSCFNSNHGEDLWILNSKMAGATSGQLLTSAARAAMMALHTPTDFSKVIGGIDITALGQWFRANDAQGVDGAVYNWPDYLGGPSAYQQVIAYRPLTGLDSGGLPILNFDAKNLLLPLAPLNNGTTAWGVGFWISFTQVSQTPYFFSISNESAGLASNKKIILFVSTGRQLAVQLFNPAGTGYDGKQFATLTAAFNLNTWNYITFEFDGTANADAGRFIITVNGESKAISIGDMGGGLALPTALRSVTGTFPIGSNGGTPTSGPYSFIGSISSIHIFKSKMVGAALGLLTRAARYALMFAAPPTLPLNSVSVLSAWLRNTTVGAISSIVDIMAPTHTATQATAARRPTGNANGSMTFDGDDVLVWPLDTSNNGTAQTAFGFWLYATTLAANHTLIEIGSGAGSANQTKLTLYVSATGNLAANIWSSNNIGRYAVSATGVILLNTYNYITIEFNGAMGTEATRLIITCNGVVLPLSFGPLGGGVAFTALNTVTGNLLIGATNISGQSGFIGTLGRNIQAFGAISAVGLVQGLLSPADRLIYSSDDILFNPVTVTGGAVTGWLRNNTVGAIESIQDVINPTNPATQLIAAVKPTGNTNGSMSFDGGDTLQWNATAQNYNTVRWGLAQWFKLSNLGGAGCLWSLRTGVNVFQINLNGSSGAIDVAVWNVSAQHRVGTSPIGALSINVPAFVTIEYDGGQATEADKCFLSVNGVKLALTFSGPAASMPAICASPGATNITLASSNNTPGQTITGTLSRNCFASQGPGGISGGGHYTAGARAALMAFEPLT